MLNLLSENFCYSVSEDTGVTPAEAQADFESALLEFDAAADWHRNVRIRELHFANASDVDAEDFFGGEDAKDETLKYSHLAVKVDGVYYGMRYYTLRPARALVGDKASIHRAMVSAGNYTALANHLNMGLPFFSVKKEALVLVRGNLVSGIYTEFNGDWEESRQFASLLDTLQQMFPAASFLWGQIDHMATKVKFKLDSSVGSKSFLSHEVKGGSVISAYKDALDRGGLPTDFLENAVPTVRFHTGESGWTQLSLIPQLEFTVGSSKTSLPLGKVMKVNHRGKDEMVWAKFLDYLDDIAATYQAGLRGVANLYSLKIQHPYSAITHALAKFTSDVPLKIVQEKVLEWQMFYPEDADFTCTAFDIYLELSWVVEQAAKDGQSSVVKFITNQETLARFIAPSFNWSAIDVETPHKFSFNKKDKDEVSILD